MWFGKNADESASKISSEKVKKNSNCMVHITLGKFCAFVWKLLTLSQIPICALSFINTHSHSNIISFASIQQ